MRSVAWFASLTAVIVLLLMSSFAGVGAASSTSYALTVGVQVSTPIGTPTPNWLNLTLQNAATGQSCHEPTNGQSVFFNSSNCAILGPGWWHVTMPPQVLSLSQGNSIYATPSNSTGISVLITSADAGIQQYASFSGLSINPATSTLKGVIEGVSPGAFYHVALLNPAFPGYSIDSVVVQAPSGAAYPASHVEAPSHPLSPAATLYTVTFMTSPSTCTISFNGGTYNSGSTATVPAGTYSIVAQACTNVAFTNWSSSVGPVAVPTSPTTNVTVSNNGFLNATYTSTASYTLYDLPVGTWTLYTYGVEANTLTNQPRYNYTAADVRSGTTTLDVNLTTNYLIWGNYHPTSLTYSEASNISVYDTTTHQIYTTFQPASGSTYYQAGLYSSNLGAQPGPESFVVFLDPHGYNSTWRDVTVSNTSRSVNYNPTIHLSNATRYYTNVTFGTNFSTATVSSNGFVGADGSIGQLPNASVANLWAQLGLDYGKSTLGVNSQEFANFTSWLKASGPIYPAQSNDLSINGTTFEDTGAFTFNAPTMTGSGSYTSNADINYSSSNGYTLPTKIGANFSSYQLSVGFQYPAVGEFESYRVMLPQGYVLENGTAAPPNTLLRPSGPVGPGGDLWTSFTILPSPYSKVSGVANFTVYKIGNVTAVVNATSSNFAFSAKNVLNSTENNYTVVVGAGQNDTFTATHSLLPPTMNVTSYTFSFVKGASCVNYTGSAATIRAPCVVGNTSTPTIHHIFATGGNYSSNLTLRTSGNVTNYTTFYVLVSDQAPSPVISVNATGITMVNSTVGYVYTNWSSNLHFNASMSTNFLWSGGPKGNISVANWTILSGTTHDWTNLTVGAGAKVLSNITYQFLGSSSYSKGSFTIPGVVKKVNLVGWAYSVALTEWNVGGSRANATLWVLVNDTQHPIAVATIQNSASHNITGGLVENANHTVEIQLLDNYSYEPHANGTIVSYSWKVNNSANMYENFSGCSLNETRSCWWNSTTDNKWFLYLPPSTGTYNFFLNVTTLSGQWGNTTYPVTVAQNLTFRPILTVSNLTLSSTTMTDGTGYTIWVNVNNTAFSKAIAYNVSADFYLTNASGGGHNNIGGAPSSVKWYGYVGGVLNSSASYTGILPEQKANVTWRAEISYTPPNGLTGDREIWVNVTASNEFAGEYASKANVASVTVTINPNPLTQYLEYVAIAVAAVVIIVVVVIFWRRRTMGPSPAKGKKGSDKSEKSSKEDKAKDSDADKDED